jgi:hypothetical protein
MWTFQTPNSPGGFASGNRAYLQPPEAIRQVGAVD